MHSVLLITVTAPFIGLGSVTSFVFWCYMDGVCTSNSSLVGNPLLPFLFVMSLMPIPVMIFLVLQRRWLYVDYSHFVFSYRTDRVARKCKICGRHPLYQKSHANRVHNLKIANLDENFEDCGCRLCYNIKLMSEGIDWLSAFIGYRKTGKA